MTDETYNGWANRETWALMLWVNNDEGLQIDFRERAAGGVDAVREWADVVFTRAGYVDFFGSEWPDSLADVASEIGSLWRVDWAEVVESLSE